MITLNTPDGGHWRVGSDYTNATRGWLRSSLRGEITVPRTGWEYWAGSGSGWLADNTVSIDY